MLFLIVHTSYDWNARPCSTQNVSMKCGWNWHWRLKDYPCTITSRNLNLIALSKRQFQKCISVKKCEFSFQITPFCKSNYIELHFLWNIKNYIRFPLFYIIKPMILHNTPKCIYRLRNTVTRIYVTACMLTHLVNYLYKARFEFPPSSWDGLDWTNWVMVSLSDEHTQLLSAASSLTNHLLNFN
jgi:hypothetical protein